MSITPFNSVGGYSTGLTGYTVIDAVGGVSAAGGTFSTIRVSGGVTLSGRVDVGGVLDVVGGVTFESTSDHVGVARFAGGVTFASTSDHTGAARFSSTTAFSGLMTFTAGLSGNGMTLSGNLSAATKSFVIPHPTKPQMTLQHGSLEGPENGVYVRGRLRGNDTITLPEYWRGLVHEDSMTVNLTEIGDRNHHWVAYIGDYTITVASERGSVDCFYTVWGERKDVGKLPVEY